MDTIDSAADSGAPASEMAYGLAGLQSASPPAAEPSTAVGAVRWLTDVKRVERYDLVFPFAIGDVEVRRITVKRLSAGAVAAWTAKVRSLPDDAPNPRFPMFYLGEVEISDEIWDAMDDDDRVALAEISEGFLPARFRR